ncbi:MAG: cation:proton antiporter, partial [Caldilineaceae bacterium]|nr:cation:proton antiporter [Caldilineaceae bacterium]
MIGLGSKWLEQSPVPATLLALLLGILLGPAVLGVLDPAVTGDEAFLMESAARLTLGIGLVGLALRIPKEYTRRNWREMLVLVGLGMILMWLISSLLVYVIMGFPLWMAALVGAIVTATDPVAAGPIVSGDVGRRNLPERIRYAISFESGANDGLSYLFVFLPLLMLTHTTRAGLNLWLSRTLLWEIGGATIFGVL